MGKVLDEFCDYLYQQVNRAMYIMGGQHTRIARESDIDRYETGINRINAKKTYRRIVKETGDPIVYAYDCSGLGMYWLYNLTHILKGDKTANGMMSISRRISANEVGRGSWVFKVYTSGTKKGRAHHIGYCIGLDKNNNPRIVSAKGRAYGVVLGETGWNAYGIPNCLADECEKVFVQRRVLKKGLKGEDVKCLQSALNHHGFKLTEDGVFGSATIKAVKAMQKKFGVDVDGQVGKVTATHLGILYGGKF